MNLDSLPSLPDSISNLDISVRTHNILRRHRIITIKQLTEMTEKELIKTCSGYMGIKTLLELKGALINAGVTFRTQPIHLELSDSIEKLLLSGRAYNALRSCKVFTIADLTKMTEKGLLMYRNLGTTTLEEIKGKLYECGYTFSQPDISERIDLLIKKGYFTKDDLIAYLNQ